MAATSTAINGCDAVIKLDNSGGTLTDISGSSNKVDIELTNKIGMVSVFGLDYPLRIKCGKDAKISLDLVYTTASGEAWSIVKDWYYNGTGSRTMTIDLPDSTAGYDRFTFEVVLESLEFSTTADEADPILVSASLLPTGSFSLAAI